MKNNVLIAILFLAKPKPTYQASIQMKVISTGRHHVSSAHVVTSSALSLLSLHYNWKIMQS